METDTGRTSGIEWIRHGDQILALLIRAEFRPGESTFLTPQDHSQQVGLIVYPKNGRVVPHRHHKVERQVEGTGEVLVVRNGRCWADFYLDDKSHFTSRQLARGDILVLMSGGHGFRMIEDTTFLEVKQGPYIGAEEKERFEPLHSSLRGS